MAKNKLIFEKDEKKSILIAVIVSIIVIVAVILAFIAIRNYRNRNVGMPPQEGAQNSGAETSGTDEDALQETVVTNQDELNEALADASTTAILFQTDDEQNIVIPSGDYDGIAMTMDAPYTDVTNYGTFARITIRQVSSDTWTESVSGNSLVVDAASAHVIVPDGITVNSIENIQTNSTLAAEVQGSVELLVLAADNSITSVKVDGELQQVGLYNLTNLTLTGSRTEATSIQAEQGAAGSTVSTAIPVQLTSLADIHVTFEPGAENSTFGVSSAGSTMVLQNNTTKDITVSKPDGTTETVAAGKAYTYTGVGSTQESQTGENEKKESAVSNTPQVGSGVVSNSSKSSSSQSGSSQSGSSQSGSSQTTKPNSTVTTTPNNGNNQYTEEQIKDMIESAVIDATNGLLGSDQVNDLFQDMLAKTVITSFVIPQPIYVGESGSEEMVSVKELGLPTQLEGRTRSGSSIFVKVEGWQNDDNYSTSAAPGVYRFTAEFESGYCLDSGARAQAVAYVGDGAGNHTIVYQSTSDNTGITVEEYPTVDESRTYYAITNQSQQSTYVGLSFYYFDDKGNLISTLTEKWFGSYIMPESGWVAEKINQGGDSSYHRYVVVVDSYTEDRTVETSIARLSAEVQDNTLNVKIGNPSYGSQPITECKVVVLITGTEDGVRKAYAYDSYQTEDCNGGINEWVDYTKSYSIGSIEDMQYVVWKTGGYAKQ